MTSDDGPQVDLELPRGVALAWGVAANPQRGPKRELSIERIVGAAIDIADEKGLAAVSMAAIASSLGFTTMSLYRYVTAKDDLILLMQEAGVGLPPLSIDEAEGWRARLSAVSRETLAVYATHPWLLDIPIKGIPNTPNNLAWLEAGLRALDETPLSDGDRLSSFILLTGHIRWQGLIERGYHERASQLGNSPSENDIADSHVLGTLVTEEQFPLLFSVIRGGLFSTGEDDSFDFGLTRILDGIEHYMSTAPKAPAQAAPEAPPESYPKDAAVKQARQSRREAEARLREALKREREAVVHAREREKNAAEKAARAAQKAARKG